MVYKEYHEWKQKGNARNPANRPSSTWCKHKQGQLSKKPSDGKSI